MALHRHLEFDVAVELQTAPDCHAERPGLPFRLPHDHPRVVFHHAEAVAPPGELAAVGVLGHESHRAGEQLPRNAADRRHLDGEEAANPLGSPSPPSAIRRPSTPSVSPRRETGVYGRDDPVVLLEAGVEPGQPRQAPRLVRAAVPDGVGRDGEGERDRERRRPGGADDEATPIEAGPGGHRHLHAAPDRLHASLGDIDGGRKLTPLPIHAALIEALDGGGGDVAGRSVQRLERDAHVGQRRLCRPDTELKGEELAAKRRAGEGRRPGAPHPALRQVRRHDDRVGAVFRKHEERCLGRGGEHPRLLRRRRDDLHRVEGVERVRRLERDQPRRGGRGRPRGRRGHSGRAIPARPSSRGPGRSALDSSR